MITLRVCRYNDCELVSNRSPSAKHKQATVPWEGQLYINLHSSAAISPFLPDITEFAAGEHPRAYDLPNQLSKPNPFVLSWSKHVTDITEFA